MLDLLAGAKVSTREDDPYRWRKSEWGSGPWDDEPDRVEWREPKLPGLVMLTARGPMGNWCGYVGVPPGHPVHGRSYQDIESLFDVHGGLTYAAPCDPVEHAAICHVPEPGEPDDVWWLGFDCGHGFDYSPAMQARLRMSSREALERGDGMAANPQHRKWLEEMARTLYEEAADMFDFGRGTYRTLLYVRTEVLSLALQLWALPRSQLLSVLRQRTEQLGG